MSNELYMTGNMSKWLVYENNLSLIQYGPNIYEQYRTEQKSHTIYYEEITAQVKLLAFMSLTFTRV